MPTLEQGKKLLAYMKAKGYRIWAINLVYLEDCNADTWQPVAGKLDAWDDCRILIRAGGEVLLSCEATTEPGRYYTTNRMNPKGAARLALGQHQDAWCLGNHKGQQALIQCNSVKVYRDHNQDGYRAGDKVDTGIFGIDHHTTGLPGSDLAPKSIGRWSAGCCVGRYTKTHYEKFIPILKASGRQLFDATIIQATDFANFGG